jgi:hypothetical protein
MIKLVEVCEILNTNSTKQYILREVYVNPKHVVSLREEVGYQKKLHEGLLPENLDSRQQFTRVTLDKGQSGLEVVVIGAPHLVDNKLNGGEKRVLKG